MDPETRLTAGPHAPQHDHQDYDHNHKTDHAHHNPKCHISVGGFTKRVISV
jgi:hypothetical protein